MNKKLKDLIRAAVAEYSAKQNENQIELISVGYDNSGHFSVQHQNKFGQFGIIPFKIHDNGDLHISLLDHEWCFLSTGKPGKCIHTHEFRIGASDILAWNEFLVALENAVEYWLEPIDFA